MDQILQLEEGRRSGGDHRRLKELALLRQRLEQGQIGGLVAELKVEIDGRERDFLPPLILGLEDALVEAVLQLLAGGREQLEGDSATIAQIATGPLEAAPARLQALELRRVEDLVHLVRETGACGIGGLPERRNVSHH